MNCCDRHPNVDCCQGRSCPERGYLPAQQADTPHQDIWGDWAWLGSVKELGIELGIALCIVAAVAVLALVGWIGPVWRVSVASIGG